MDSRTADDTTPEPAEATPPAPRPPRAVLVAAGVLAVLVAALILALLPRTDPLTAHESGDPELAAEVRDALPDGAADSMSGISVATIDGGEIRQAALGSAHGSTPVTTDTPFETGSVQKTLTAGLLADLLDKGEVTLDTTIGEIWDGEDLDDDVAAITLEQLATHHSGLPRDEPGFGAVIGVGRQNLLGDNPNSDFTPPIEVVRDIALDKGEDGTASYAYSNLGFALLGSSLARVAGTDYTTAVTERVLDPVGMDGTQLLDRGRPADGAMPYRGPYSPVMPFSSPEHLPVGAGTWSTSADLAAWVRAAMDEDDPLTRVAQQPRADAGDGERNGLAWIITEVDGTTLTWHDGGTTGSRAYIGHTDDGRGVVVLSNSSTTPADEIGRRLLGLDASDDGGGLATTVRFTITLSLTLVFGFVTPLMMAVGMLRRSRPVGDRLALLVNVMTGVALWLVALRMGDWATVPVAVLAAGGGLLAGTLALSVWRGRSVPLNATVPGWAGWLTFAVGAAVAVGIAAMVVSVLLRLP